MSLGSVFGSVIDAVSPIDFGGAVGNAIDKATSGSKGTIYTLSNLPPGTPQADQVAAALSQATPAELATLRAAASGTWCAAESGGCVGTSDLMTNPALLAFHAWGGRSGSLETHEFALHNAVVAIMTAHGTSGAPYTTYQVPQPSAIDRAVTSVKDIIHNLPGNVATATVDAVGRTVYDASAPQRTEIIQNKAMDVLPWVIGGAVVAFLWTRR
jgi:hypothetical protein